MLQASGKSNPAGRNSRRRSAAPKNSLHTAHDGGSVSERPKVDALPPIVKDPSPPIQYVESAKSKAILKWTEGAHAPQKRVKQKGGRSEHQARTRGGKATRPKHRDRHE